MGSHRRPRDPQRMRKAAGVIAVAGVVGFGVAVLSFAEHDPAPRAEADQGLQFAAPLETPSLEEPSVEMATPSAAAVPTPTPSVAVTASPAAQRNLAQAAADGSVRPTSAASTAKPTPKPAASRTTQPPTQQPTQAPTQAPSPQPSPSETPAPAPTTPQPSPTVEPPAPEPSTTPAAEQSVAAEQAAV